MEHPFSRDRHRFLAKRISRALLNSPARLSIFGFASLISIGTLLLMLPGASRDGSIGFVDALFTATSASCVTGLVVMDTGTALSPFGQGVVLLLIQVGGLGIMTISTLFLLLARRRPSLAGRMVIQDAFTTSGERSLSSVLWDVILFTLVIEGIGTILIFFRLLPERGLLASLYVAVFHAISAFCNAGFSLFSDSLMSYREDWIMNLVIDFLIVTGGIGFLVLSEVKQQFPFRRRTWSRFSLHTKVVLSTTALLLVSSTLLILLMEWHNTLAPLSVHARFLAAFFQSVTARTAGFNTLPIGEMANESLFFLILLMFIGASPGSCGGGIKTTALASLTMLGISRLRGQERPQLFRRTIPEGSVGRAVSIVMISAIVIIAATMGILITELGEVPHIMSRGKFLELFFEVVSAFGTVGLSAGVTGELSAAGKIILTIVMFMGRLGPLVIAIAVSRRSPSRYYFAEESIMVG